MSAVATEPAPLAPPLEVDGHKLERGFRPESGEELADALRGIEAHGLSAWVRGNGSRDRLGGVPHEPDLWLDPTGLDGVHDLDVEEGVLHAGAGSRLASLRAALAGTGWELPLDPPGPDATLGGTLGAAAGGPCFPRARDAVLGLEVALVGGARTRCGGRVVKNVTGYDLAKLYVGSLGTLGVIEAAWLRLRPVPEARVVLALELAEGLAQAGLVELARRPGVRAALALDASLARDALGEGEGAVLLLELAGDASTVETETARLRERGAQEVELAALDAARELARGEPAELALRVGVVPGAVGRVSSSLAQADARVLAEPARGVVIARHPGAGDAAAKLAFARELAAEGEGSARVESAPAEARRGLDVFGLAPEAARLTRALLDQFDPKRLLSPGRLLPS